MSAALRLVAALVWGALATCPAHADIPAGGDTLRDHSGALAVFPGAEGFGTTTRAGRGGAILRVTNLADSGPGSLREAVESPGARIIVFEVGGTIRLADRLNVGDPFVTIAGQTAPSPGITLAGDTLKITTHDVLVQHLRVRVGDDPANSDPERRDGISVAGNESGSLEVYNVVVDHCSVSWATDENLSTWYPNVHDVTFSNNISSEALMNSIHPEGAHSMGMLVGQHSQRIAVLRNLFAHNNDRNPRFPGDTSALVVNNLMYNVRDRVVDLAGSEPSWLSVMGNAYVPGLDSREARKTVVVTNGEPDTRLHVSDNDGPGRNEDPWSVVDNRVGSHVRAAEPPVLVRPLTLIPASATAAAVLQRTGARPADRDVVDLRIVRDVGQGTGRIIDSPSDVGGLPDLEATSRGLSLPGTPHADSDGDGYTDIEELLHCMAARVEGLPGDCPGPDGDGSEEPLQVPTRPALLQSRLPWLPATSDANA